MKIPESVMINGFVWEVRFDRSVANEGNCFGSCHHSTQSIYLDPSTTRQKQEETFLHEVLHAVAWHSGLERRMINAKQNDLLEEIVTSLAGGLFQTLSDNGLLADHDGPRRAEKE